MAANKICSVSGFHFLVLQTVQEEAPVSIPRILIFALIPKRENSEYDPDLVFTVGSAPLKGHGGESTSVLDQMDELSC